MTIYAPVAAEFGAAFMELRPRVQLDQAGCQFPGCTAAATFVLSPGVDGYAGPSRMTCAEHLEESLHLIGLVPEGTVTVRRLQ